MNLDPRTNPIGVIPVLLVLSLIFLLSWRSRMGGRMRLAVLLLIGFLIIIFFASRIPLV